MLLQAIPPAAPVIESRRPQDAAYTPVVQLPPPPQPVQVPGVDLAVEVIGNLPLQIKIENLTRLLGARSRTRPINRVAYPTTILELITLVERNPEKPRGKGWDSISALTVRFDPVTTHVSVEYCVEHCEHAPRTGAFNPRRRMAYYHAPEAEVLKRTDKKLAKLKKYAGPTGPP